MELFGTGMAILFSTNVGFSRLNDKEVSPKPRGQAVYKSTRVSVGHPYPSEACPVLARQKLSFFRSSFWNSGFIKLVVDNDDESHGCCRRKPSTLRWASPPPSVSSSSFATTSDDAFSEDQESSIEVKTEGRGAVAKWIEHSAPYQGIMGSSPDSGEVVGAALSLTVLEYSSTIR